MKRIVYIQRGGGESITYFEVDPNTMDAQLQCRCCRKSSKKELCLVVPLTVGFHAVARSRIKADDTVAILGCGGMGSGVVAASSARGARTICVDMDDEKLVVARAASGSDAINTAKESLRDRLQELTEGRGLYTTLPVKATSSTAARKVCGGHRPRVANVAPRPWDFAPRLFQ